LQAAFCFTCVKAAETNSLSTQTLSQGDAFLRKGYQNWKHALEKARGFQKHEMSQAHKEATIRYVKSSSNQPDVVDMVSSEAEKQRFKNRQMLLKILTNIRFLARQGLPLRGSWNKEYNIEIDSNFHQLILPRCENQRDLQSWLDQSTDKYTSPKMQNCNVTSLSTWYLKRTFIAILSSEFYTVMARAVARDGRVGGVAINFADRRAWFWAWLFLIRFLFLQPLPALALIVVH